MPVARCLGVTLPLCLRVCRYWEQGVVRRVRREALELAEINAQLAQTGSGRCDDSIPEGVTVALIDRLLAAALSQHHDVTKAKAASVRRSVLALLLREGPVPREALLLGWVLREGIGGAQREGGYGGAVGEGVDARDVVAHTIGLL